eukprot:TRINITY_DN5639_c3_g2_i1.p2 TRINITY_DN5639_c3_g2~~TRINITY_DN5639_c3_g2_i1.p2  ORF type:complete len:680 (+),score=169.50 TRINITY_DN5639_c3_g2_i1:58-2097(+)
MSAAEDPSGERRTTPRAAGSPSSGERRSPISPRQGNRGSRAASPVTPSDINKLFADGSKDAKQINDIFFSIQEAPLAKRLTVFDHGQVDDGESKSVHASPESDAVDLRPVCVTTPTPHKPDLGTILSDDQMLEPTPLNCTLGHSMTQGEYIAAHKRGIDQINRLSRLQRGCKPTHHQRDSEPLIIALVGLPASGKTYIARRLMRYLTWMGIRSKVFNVGLYRRKLLGFRDAGFFDPAKDENVQRREEVVDAVLEDVESYLCQDNGQVAIYDATSATRARRRYITQKLLKDGEGVVQHGRLIFLEITCSRPDVREEMIKEAGRTMPEYRNSDEKWTVEEAIRDVRARRAHYEREYEPLSPEEDMPYICVDPTAERMRMHRIKGYLPGRLAFLLMNLRIKRRHIFICETAQVDEKVVKAALAAGSEGALPASPLPPAHAADQDDFPGAAAKGSTEVQRSSSQSALKGSARLRDMLAATPRQTTEPGTFLSQEGERFSRGLVGLLQDRIPAGEAVTVWASGDDAGQATSAYLAKSGYNIVFWRYLGPFGFSVSQKMMGETYEDVTERLEPIIFEIERSPTHLLIIASPRVAQLLSAYLGERSAPEAMHANTVVRVLPSAFGIESEEYTMHVQQQAEDDPHVPTSPFNAGPLWSGSPASAGMQTVPSGPHSTDRAVSPVEIET